MTSTDHTQAAKRVAKMIAPMWQQFINEDWDAWVERHGLDSDKIRAALLREYEQLSVDEAKE